MPRIDPMKLLVCLSVLLAPNGGIRTSAEVKRLANLMAKFSKKLVSKCIYIQILKCTETELLGQFMQTGGWSLVHLWLVDGVTSKNWPLIQELLELLLCCPVDVERLKINTTPRLVKALSTDSAHERVRVLASKLVEQWLFIVKAPKQPSPSIPSDVPLGDHSVIDGQPAILGGGVQEEPNNNVGLLSEATPTGNDDGSGCHLVNGVGGMPTDGSGSAVKDIGNKQGLRKREDDVDSAKKSFRAVVEQEPHKKTSLVLKITTKNGKQVVTEVRTPTSAMNGDNVLHRNGTQADGDDDIEEEEEDEEEDEEVVVNIESEKPNDQGEDGAKDAKKHDLENGREARERSGSVSSSSKDHRSHHSSRDREKDRKGSSSSGSRSSSSKSSSGSSKSKSSSSSSSSSKSSSSSSSRDKDKERHGSSSSSSSKHKSSSSSSSKSSGSGGSKSSRSSSDKHRDHRDKSNHSGGSSGKDNKDSKSTSQSPGSGGSRSSSSSTNLSRKSSKDDGGNNDSGSETGSNSANNSSASLSGVGSSKKASISIEVRNPENRVKTVKTYNSQFRSHGLIEEAPPPPSRKGLKKPSSGTSTSTASTTATGSAAAVAGTKRLSPAPSSSPSSVRDAAGGAPLEKRLKEDPAERPGAIKLIAPKRQHALVESDMFMDALSATLRKDVKKRKRRTSGSDSNTTPATTPTTPTGTVGGTKATESGSATGATKPSSIIPESPTKKTMGAEGGAVGGDASESITAGAAATKEATPVTTPPPIVAPMSFYRDTLAEDDEQSTAAAEGTEEGKKEETTKDGSTKKKEEEDEDGDDAEAVTRKPKRVKCELNDDDDDDDDDNESKADCKEGVKKEATGDESMEEEGMSKGGAAEQSNALVDAMMNDVEMKMAAEEEEAKEEPADGAESDAEGGKKPPGPGCGPDGPPGVLVIHRRKGPKKQLRWRAAEDLEEIRYFELDVTERCNVTKSFTDMKNLERVDERQKFLLARKVGSEDNMTERTVWRPLVLVDNVPPAPDGNQSVERAVQHQRERSVLQALYFNKHMIPDCPVEPEPADMYQTADPVHIPLEDVTGNPDSVNDFTSMPWPDPRSTPPHDSAAFNSPFFPADLPPGAGFGPGGFPLPFPGGMPGPAPWQMPGPPPGAGGRPAAGAGVLPPGMFPSLNQPPPGLGGGGGTGGNSPNMMLNLNLPPNVPPPGMFPGAGSFNSPPPDLGLLEGGGAGRRGDGQNFRSSGLSLPPWINNNRSFGGGGGGSGGSSGIPSQRGGHYGNRGAGGGGNWNNRSNGSGGGANRGSAGERGRSNNSNSGGAPWMQNNRGHSNRAGGGGGGSRKW